MSDVPPSGRCGHVTHIPSYLYSLPRRREGDRMASVVTDEMRSILGVSLGGSVSYPISASDIRKWAMAVHFPQPPPRHFVDVEYARTTPFGGVVAREEFTPFAGAAAAAVRKPPPKPPLDADPALTAVGANEHRYGVAPPDLRHGLN